MINKSLGILILAAVTALTACAQEEGVSRDEAYKSIKDFQTAQENWYKRYSEIYQSGKSQEEMRKEVDKLGRMGDPADMVDEAKIIIASDPTDDKAFEALKIISNAASPFRIGADRNKAGAGPVVDEDYRNKAVEILLTHHIKREDVLSAFRTLPTSKQQNIEVLRKVYELNPHHKTKGNAVFQKVTVLSAAAAEPVSAQEREQMLAEVEASIALLADEYSDLTMPMGRGGGERAYSELAQQSYDRVKSLLEVSKAADIELLDFYGNKDKLTNYRGKYVLLDFWATWCGPCKAGLPAVVKLKEKLNGLPFEVITLSLDDTVEEAIEYKDEHQPMPFVNWHAGPQNDFLETLGVINIPTYILLDPQGNILSRSNTLDDASKKYIEELVKAKAKS